MPGPRAWLACCVMAVAAASGCGSGPSAPALRSTSVYQNQREGFRFLVPDGWVQTASTVLPAGAIEGETFLARYRLRSPEGGASLQVLVFQESEPVDLHEHHAGPAYGVAKWPSTQQPEQLEIGGKAASRLVYQAKLAGRDTTKEVVCFRHGDRVYSFVGLFASIDDKAREQIRRAVESTIWDGAS